MPRLNLLADDRLDLSVVFTPVLDEGLDGFFEIVGHFTTEDGISHLCCTMLLKMTGLPIGADIVDYRG